MVVAAFIEAAEVAFIGAEAAAFEEAVVVDEDEVDSVVAAVEEGTIRIIKRDDSNEYVSHK